MTTACLFTALMTVKLRFKILPKRSHIIYLICTLLRQLKVMLHKTIRNDDFWRNMALQHCCDIDSNGYNIVPVLQRCNSLKIVVANRPV